MAVKAAALDKRQALTKVQQFFQAFQQCCNQKGAIQASLLEGCLTKNFHLTVNDQHKAKNLTDYLHLLQKFQQKFSHIEIIGPSHEPLVEGNRIAIQYSINYTLENGQKNEVFSMALLTFEDQKISSWNQVTHEKGTERHWHT